LGTAERLAEMSARTAAALDCLVATVRLPIRAARKLLRLTVRLVGKGRAVPTAHAPVARAEVTTGEFLVGRVAEQRIVCTEDGWCSVRLRVGTYNRVNSSHLHITVLDERGNPLRSTRGSVSQCHDNFWYTFSFEEIVQSAGRTYRVRVCSPDAAPGNAVTLWHRQGDEDGFCLDGQALGGALLCLTVYAREDPLRLDGQRDLLIVTPDYLGRIRIGLGMRHWEIAKALASRGLAVTLATPHPFSTDLRPEGFALYQLNTGNEAIGLARRHRCVMVQGIALKLFPELRASGLPIITDVVTPQHLENLERNQQDYEHSRRFLLDGLRESDFFICGNERQRLHWLGMLVALGRVRKEIRDADPELRNLIDVVGFGIPTAPPQKTRAVLKGVVEGIGPEDFVMTWFGGIWDWMDPLPLIRATGEAWKENPRIKLFFSAYRRPDGGVPEMAGRARDLATELGLLARCVFFNEYPVPFDDRADYLLETDIGILCQSRNLETQVSARTRVLDYLWVERPLLMNEGDEWAEEIRRHDLGLIIEGNEVRDWKQAMLRLAGDPAGLARMRANIATLKPRLLWTKCVEPIHRFVMQQRAYMVPDWGQARKAG
jgi:hypothetical protein